MLLLWKFSRTVLFVVAAAGMNRMGSLPFSKPIFWNALPFLFNDKFSAFMVLVFSGLRLLYMWFGRASNQNRTKFSNQSGEEREMQGIIWIIKHSCQKIVNGVCFGCETKLHQKPLDWFRQWFWISLSRYQTASIYNNSFEIRFIVVDLILGIFIIFELPNPQESGNEKHSPIFSSCFFVRAFISVWGNLTSFLI